MTTAQIKKINQAICETGNLIQKEMGYSEDLRKETYLAELQKHMSKLLKMVKFTGTFEEWIAANGIFTK